MASARTAKPVFSLPPPKGNSANEGRHGLASRADVCYIVGMDLPDIGRYRRRFIVEFGPEDSGLVDRVGEVYKTKRAAIIAGLRLLDSGETEQMRARLAALEAELSSARDAWRKRQRLSATRSRPRRWPRPICEKRARNSRRPVPRCDGSRPPTRRSAAILTKRRRRPE